MIGDSITVGYSPTVISNVGGRFAVDYLGFSRSLNDPALLKEVGYVLSEENYQFIHMNNGLHGWHLSSQAYENYLRELLQFIRLYGGQSKLAWAQSTPVTQVNALDCLDPFRNAQVIARNEVAAKIMQDENVPINDLYVKVQGRTDLRCNDGLHYNDDGNRFLRERRI